MAAVDPDLCLLERWRTGELRAGQELFSRHFADVYRFFEHKVGPEADDLAQQTFTACVAAVDRFRGGSTFRTYLFAIARHQLYTFLRRLPRGEHVDFEQTSIGELIASPSSQLGRARDVERLRIALAGLPAEQQLLLELHYWYDLDADALGEVFETTPGAIRVRLLRARKVLRDRMGQIDLAHAKDGLLTALSTLEHEDPGSPT
jgi:RNA polymerase sigma-70 factor (ECF subfamily)